MRNLHLFPFVRMLVPFVLGTALALMLRHPPDLLPFFYGIPVLLMLMYFSQQYYPAFRARWIFGVVFTLWLVVTGYQNVIFNTEILREDHFSKSGNLRYIAAEVIEIPVEKQHSFKLVVSPKAISDGKVIHDATGKMLCYISKDSIAKVPEFGDLLLIAKTPAAIKAPSNPGAFDFRKSMAARNIYHQVYLKADEWKLIHAASGFNLRRSAIETRNYFLGLLKENGLTGPEFAVVSAMILGQDDFLDAETRKFYSGTGVMHILCVSGLHVGIIFLIANTLLKPLNRNRKLRIIKASVIIIMIWSYAFITGFSPSVIRAATMFSFVVIGNLTHRFVHIINSIAVSAFVLLLINPLLLLNIGFQLSYLAVLGIVLIYSKISALFEPQNQLLDFVWQLFTVSLSAQIATAPLSIFYFHQFPVYFLPANLIAIPVSNLAIYTGIAVLFTSPVHIVSNLLGSLLVLIIKFLNGVLHWIETLPFASIHPLSIDPEELALIYLILGFLVLLIYSKSKRWVFVSLILMAAFGVLNLDKAVKRNRQEKVVFFDGGKNAGIAYISGSRMVVVTDSMMAADRQTFDFALSGSFGYFGAKAIEVINLDTLIGKIVRAERFMIHEGRYLALGNVRILIADKIPSSCPEKRLEVDYFYLRNNPGIKIEDILGVYSPKTVIVDKSSRPWRRQQWKEACRKNGISFHDLDQNGSLVIDLSNRKSAARSENNPVALL